ncbi:PREDICTED: uncharacterized protein LOC106101357 isoform X2 [Papilio polytes]|uniref:uncharacterized protein LOC106101357 isoform X2 n=1 Tax=Papilio polytes TaxID=76194 RepID=UPI0006768DFD|nr:PREDICTED: uncharacterized protein LOC106101357 isoform X2 [Papilio polytes]
MQRMREAFVDGASRGATRAPWAMLLLALLFLNAPRSLAQDDENLSQTGNDYKRCVRRHDHREGVCVHFTQCYKNYSLAFGGNLFNYEIRDGEPPIKDCGRDKWCCTDDTDVTAPLPTPAHPADGGATPAAGTGNCLRAFDVCPWCVALYRPGGDLSRGHITESGLYCGGALVGPRVVLTSASCIATVGEESVWARVPASAAPARRYSVLDRLRHAGYNSGNGKNDFGLMVLKDSVEFAASPFSACVSLSPPPAAGCRAVGFDNLERVVLTPVSLRDGDCPPRNRSIPDLTCAAAAAPSSTCHISPGAPLLCPAGDAQGGLALSGVVRRACRAGSAHVGKLQPHAEWLQLQLRRLGVPDWQYAL